MSRPLCVSPSQLRDEIGAADPYSPVATYLSRSWGSDPAKQDEKLTQRIREAQSKIENRLNIYFFHTRIVTTPVTAGLVLGQDYDTTQDGYPYSKRDFSSYATIILRRRPVVSIQRAGLRYGNSDSFLAHADFPDGWVQPQTRLGVLHILPLLGLGGSQMSGGTFLMLPIMAGMMPSNMTIPLLLSVDYTAGFLPTTFNPDEEDAGEICRDLDPTSLITAVRMMAAANCLRALGRAIAPGGGSIGMDGFSQSWGGNRFGPEIQDYEAKVEESLVEWLGNQPIPVFTLN